MSIQAPLSASFVVKKTPNLTPEQRKIILEKTDYNVFNFPAAAVSIDFLTDSGTAALYPQMWAGIMLGDESYARNAWYYAFLDAVRDFTQRGNKPQKRYLSLLEGKTGFEEIEKNLIMDNDERGFVNGGSAQLETPNTFLLPQGRCCETTLFQNLRKQWKEDVTPLVLSNGLFDTTRANAMVAKFETLDLFNSEMFSPFPLEKVGIENPFRGNIDIAKAETILSKDSKRVAMIVMTLTNNTGAGQPVSMANMKDVKKLCLKYGLPLWIDAARVVDNAAFIQKFEKGFEKKSISVILQELFELADGFHFSMKKALCNMGGVMCFKHGACFDKKYPKIGHEMKKTQIISYGNDSYGALSGRDLAAMTVALYQVVKEDYILPRLELTQYLAVGLAREGLPVVLPPGGHAVYLDINKMFPKCLWSDFMGVGLASELLEKYGIRACELGYMAWELDRYVEEHGKMPEFMPPNLVRLAIPANVYGRDHMNYTIFALSEINKSKDKIPGFEIIRGKDLDLRHFVVGLRPKKTA